MKILFISHDASRTGAPAVLLHLMNWLSNHADVEMCILLRKDGALLEEFQKLGETKIWPTYEKNKKRGLKKKIKDRVKRFFNINTDVKEQIKSWIKSKQFDLVYSNSAASSDLLCHIKIDGVPVIQHVHELEMILQSMCHPDFFSQSHLFTNAYIAVSGLVKDNLINNHQIPSEKIELINEFVPPPIVNKDKQEIRKILGLPDNAFVVGGSGTLDWRKGIDLFIQTAYKTPEFILGRQVCFVWVGGNLESPVFKECLYDIAHYGLDKRCFITGSVSDPANYFNIFDIFLMTSREDPFPLVCIENAYLKKPIICFEGVVGSADFVSKSTGAVVAYADVDCLVKEVRYLLENEDERTKKGNAIFDLISSEYRLEKLACKVKTVIESVIR